MLYYYNRYKQMRVGDSEFLMPRVIIPKAPSDKVKVYEKGITRFDKLSEDYYDNPLHGFLIMCANPQIGAMEFDIENGTVLTIPFPFESALTRYNDALKEHIRLEGLK